MGTNKTKPTSVSVASFISGISQPEKRSDAKALVALIKRATGDAPKMWGPSIIGFGTYHYRHESGREGDMPLVGFSPRKPALVFYGVIGFKGAQGLLAKLGTYTTGKGCLYVKRLSNVKLEVLEELIVAAVAAKRSD